MTNELKDKLRLALDNNSTDEYRVVYILSRIRKIMEIENTKNKYKILNIFCNWSLHAKIDSAEDMRDIIKEFVLKPNLRANFFDFKEFSKEFKKFVSEVLNIDLDELYITNFIKVLINIISDTPLSIKQTKVITLTINPKELPRNEDQITYKLTEHNK